MPIWQMRTVQAIQAYLLAAFLIVSPRGGDGGYFDGLATDVFGIITIPASPSRNDRPGTTPDKQRFLRDSPPVPAR